MLEQLPGVRPFRVSVANPRDQAAQNLAPGVSTPCAKQRNPPGQTHGGTMNILHVLGQRPEKTGSGIYLHSIMRKAQEHGFSNHLLAGIPAGNGPELEGLAPEDCSYVYFESDRLNFPVTGMSDVMPYKSSLFKELQGERLDAYKAAFEAALQQTVGRFQPDVIHANHLLVVTALVRKLFPDIPLVATCHGTDLRQFHNCPHLRTFVKKYCRRIDRVIALSGDQKREISRTYDILPEKIVVTGGGYDETIFNRAPKSTAETVQILYAGKFNRSKGVPWLLRALPKIEARNWHLHMAGGGRGPEYEACLDLARNLGSRVTVHGYVTHRRLAQLMKTAHIQVLPSFFEGLPLVLFEGLASGCRIITTNLSGFEEIFSRAGRDTVRLLDLPPLATIDRPYAKDEARLEATLAASLAEMMATVRTSPDFEDPGAAEIANTYTWQRVFERVSAVYREAVSQRS